MGGLDFDKAPSSVDGWSVGDAAVIRSAMGPKMAGHVRSFVAAESGRFLAVVAVKPSDWLEAVPVAELQRPAGEAPSAFHQREAERLRARKVLCSFDPRA